jgi:hypothetical protein
MGARLQAGGDMQARVRPQAVLFARRLVVTIILHAKAVLFRNVAYGNRLVSIQ